VDTLYTGCMLRPDRTRIVETALNWT